MVLAFFLIWNAYPKDFDARRWLQTAGIAILIFLAFTFRTPDGGYIRAGWWGILGLIGWAYVFCSTAYVLLRKKPLSLLLLWLALIIINMFLTRLRSGHFLLTGPTFINDMASALNLGNGSAAIMAMTRAPVPIYLISIFLQKIRVTIPAARQRTEKMIANIVLFLLFF
jgi:hypothetical protein